MSDAQMTTRSGKVYRMDASPEAPDTYPLKNAAAYVTKKTITQGLLDVALLTANVSQLKYVYSVGAIGPNAHPFYHLMMSLLSVSIVLQITTGLCLLFLGKSFEDARVKRAAILNDMVTVQVFLIAVINILISSFGIEESVQRSRKLDNWERTNKEYFANCTCFEPSRVYSSSEYYLKNCHL